jgi:hypothetical protein
MNTSWKYLKTGYWDIRERRYQTAGDNFIINFTVYTMHGRDGEYTMSVRKPAERRIFETQLNGKIILKMM